jgi:hypothetical protein
MGLLNLRSLLGGQVAVIVGLLKMVWKLTLPIHLQEWLSNIMGLTFFVVTITVGQNLAEHKSRIMSSIGLRTLSQTKIDSHFTHALVADSISLIIFLLVSFLFLAKSA